MNHASTNAGPRHRLRALALIAFLVGACDGTDRLGNTDPTMDGAAVDSVAVADSLALADSLKADSLKADSVAADSLGLADTTSILASVSAKSSIPFGPFSLWTSYDRAKPEAKHFTASINYTDAYGIVRQISAARAQGQKLMLMMTDDGRAPYMSRGRFDLGKWKRRMDRYRTPAIRSAVARAVAEGTVIGNSVIDEPKHRTWHNSINKSVVDQMCRYVKGIFPTLPVGVVVVHWWRPTERYRVCDFIVDQYDWAQPANGWGTRGGGRGDVAAWRTAALAQARKDGISIAFSMNVLDGGPETRGCPLRTTGGRGTYSGHCRMTAGQVKQFGLALGPSGCALLMWKHDKAFISKSANITALRQVGARLASSSTRGCRRTG